MKRIVIGFFLREKPNTKMLYSIRFFSQLTINLQGQPLWLKKKKQNKAKSLKYQIPSSHPQHHQRPLNLRKKTLAKIKRKLWTTNMNCSLL